MTEKLKNLLLEIESGERKHIFGIKLTKEELLIKDENGLCFLEHLLKNNISLYSLINEIKNSVEIAYLFCEYGESLYFFELDEKELFSEINGKRFIDYVLEKDKITKDIINSIKEHIEIIDMLVLHKMEYLLDNLSQDIVDKLMIKNNEETYLIEKYFNNEKALNKMISLVNDVNKLIELCEKYNNYELIKNANENVLMSSYDKDNSILHYLINEKNIIPNMLNEIPKNLNFINFLIDNNYYDYLEKASERVQLLEIEPGKTLLEFLIEKGKNPSFKYIWEDKTIRILNKNNKLDLIKDASESMLLKPVNDILGDNVSSENETLLEYMLDNGYNPLLKTTYISSGNILKILYKKQRADLLSKGNFKKLLEFTENKNTYFDYILDNIKEGKIKTSVQDMRPSRSDIELLVKYYVIIAKHGMMEYVSELTEDNLLKEYDGKTFLEILLDNDSDLTLNKILSNSVKSKPKIAVIIKSKGLLQENVDVSVEKNKYAEQYLEGVQNSLGIGPLLQEGELLLNQLQQLFLSDGKSDEGLISTLISGYRHSLLINYEINIEEIKKLISIKQQNPDKFLYIKKADSGYFSPINGAIYCDSDVVETVLHETGHALHHYLVDSNIPENYQEVIDNARKNPETLKNVEEYANKYQLLRKEIIIIVKQKYDKFFESYYNEDKKNTIFSFLNKSKDEKRNEYSNLGIPGEQLDMILEGMYTVDEYIAHQKRIFMNENIDAIMRSEFGAFMAIGDILDAIYEGGLHSGSLKNQQGESIKRTAGHGIRYYYATSHGFDEMVANFAFISKSKDSESMLQLLKDTVGDELYSMLSEFYYQNIVQLETRKSIGGK